MYRAFVSFLCLVASAGSALAQTVYNNIPSVLAGNYSSLGYQATQTAQFGDRITLDGTERRLQSVTVTMSSWAPSENYGGAFSFNHPLTLNIFADNGTGTPGSLLATRTQTFAIPYRPTGWGFNGIAFNATFDFSSLNITLPDTLIYGLAYNTQTWGAAPLGVDGPYNSLNFALNKAGGGGVTVGANNDLDDVFWNTCTAGWYTDGGAGGVCTFRRDTVWTGFTPMAKFVVGPVNTYATTTTQFGTPWYSTGNSGLGSSGITGYAGLDSDGAAELRGDRTRFATGNIFPNSGTPGPNLGLLSDLVALDFDWIVTALGVSGPTNYSPALRVHTYDPATGRRMEFIWENGEQSAPIPAPLLNVAHSGDFFGAANRVHVSSAIGGTNLGRGIFDSSNVLIPGSDAALPLGSHLATLANEGSTMVHITGLSLGIGSFGGQLNNYISYADHVNIEVAGGLNQTYNFVAGGNTAISLNAFDTCTNATQQLIVDVDLTDAGDLAVGGQFFLQYDDAVLDFVSAVPGVAPFTEQIFESVNEGMGTIDYAVGVIPGGVGATSGRMARFTFNVLNSACSTPALVVFRPHAPPTRVTNNLAQSILPLATNSLGGVTLDLIAPVVTVPSTIAANTDAGSCTNATVEFNAVATDNCNTTQSPFLDTGAAGSFSTGNWVVDRYAPGVWTPGAVNPNPGGGTALHLGIRNADRFENRPPAFQSLFYSTQGRQRASNLTQGFEVTGKLYIPASWAVPGNLRRSDLWARDTNPVEGSAKYLIVGFINSALADEAGGIYHTNTPNFVARFRAWDSSIGWIDLPGVPVLLNQYNTFRMVDTGVSHQYYINGNLVHTNASYSDPAGFGMQTAYIEGRNFGHPMNAGDLPDSSYDIYWKDVSASKSPSKVTIQYTLPGPTVITSPHVFPVGTSTVTATATDACGNTSSGTFNVVVTAQNTLLATVQLANVSPGTYTRCITFDLYRNGPCGILHTTSATMTFVNGLSTTTINVPCGTYTCSTARDRLHTLRRTDGEFGIVGLQYVTNFTTTGTDDSLLGGNANDDEYIDILDFGGFVGQFGLNVGANTTCATSPLHTDFSGSGFVDPADFTFIGNQFLFQREADCCGGLLISPPGGGGGGPVVRISNDDLVKRGLGTYRFADVNHDGWLDSADMAAFLNGARPCGADVNLDGQITSADFFDFLTAFFRGDADFNRDGVTTSNDFFDFLSSFFTGC